MLRTLPHSLGALAIVGLLSHLALTAGCRREEPIELGVEDRITDYSGVLSWGQLQAITDFLEFVEVDRAVDYRVVVLAEPATDLVREGVARYASLGIGARTAGQGLLLLVDLPSERARVEVGYELEHRVRDVEASSMITEFLAPYFASERPAIGIEASVERLIEVLEPSRAAKRSREPLLKSGGAGATAAIAGLLEGVDELTPRTRKKLERILVPQARPEDCVHLEVALLQRGIYHPEASMYDEAWRAANRRPNFPASRKIEMGEKLSGPFEVARDGEHAIAYFTGEKRLRNGPWFLRRTPQGWVLETSVVFANVIYDYSSHWFALEGDYPYLQLIKSVYPMRRVTSNKYGAAWGIDSEAEPEAG